jgi:hypothetical protein
MLGDGCWAHDRAVDNSGHAPLSGLLVALSRRHEWPPGTSALKYLADLCEHRICGRGQGCKGAKRTAPKGQTACLILRHDQDATRFLARDTAGFTMADGGSCIPEEHFFKH